MNEQPVLSIILPTYNERENIRQLIPEIIRSFRGVPHEILVVDDSSPDGTAEEARRLSRDHPQIRVIVRKEKTGIGSALRAGYKAAQGNIILSSDADFSYPVEDLFKLFAAIRDGADLAIGSRHTKSSYYQTPRFGIWLKYSVSYWGNALLSRMFGIPVRDFSANCRAIRRATWETLNTREDTNFFLFEMIFLAKSRGARIVEIPIRFLDRRHGESKINHWIEIPKAFWKMIVFLTWRKR